MAKLSIDIWVNLGEASRQLGKLNSALISLNSNAEKLVSTLKQIGKINIKPTVGMNTGGASPQATPKQVPNVFEQYTQGASSASNITDLLEAKLEQLVARSNELKQTLAGGIGFMNPSSSLEELKQVENQIKNVQGLLKSQSFNIVAPKNVPDIFKDFRSGASGAATAIDFLRQREQELINQSNTLKASLSTSVSAGGFQQAVRDIKQVEDELKKVQSLLAVQPPDIFADFKSGAIQAATAFDFLEIKEQELIQKSLQLKNALRQAGSGEEFEKLQNELNQTEKELNDVTRALNSQRGAIGGATTGYGNLTKSTNLANLSVINLGRVFQDLPFGILGIANNLNPLVEGLRDLNVEAKKNSSSLGKELLNSLKGFGGVTLAISAVSAALSFASVGLSYWARESKKAKDENDKFAESLDKAKSSALSTGLQLQALLAIASDSTKPLDTQKEALNKLNDSFSKYTIKLDEASLKNGEAKRAVENLTNALIQQAIASKGADKLADLYIKLAKDQDNLKAATDKLSDARKREQTTFLGAAGAILFGAAANKDLGSAENEARLAVSATTKEIEDAKKTMFAAAAAANAFEAALTPSDEQLARIDLLNKKIKDEEDKRKKITGTYAEQEAAYIAINKQIAIYQSEIDKILGKENKTGKSKEREKSLAQKVADLYKEINADLIKIESRRDLNPLEKATESAKVLKSGLDKILDLDIKQLDTSAFKELETRLQGFEEIKIRLEVSQIKQDLETTLESLRQKGSFFNIDTTKDQIKEVESAIDKLYQKFQDKKVSPFEKQSIFLDIAILQSGLRQLNLDALVKSGETAFKDLTIDVEKLKQKKILLGVDIGKEGLNLAKKAIDTINEKKIELLSEKDPVRAAQLNDEIKEAQGIFSQFRSVAISESFKEYEDAAIRINEEFQRTSQFLRSDKKLEFKIETDKKKLDLVSKEIEDELKLGISPLDPRIIFSRILQTKLKLQIEADTESLKLLQEQTELVRDTLEDTFSGIGDAIGTALAEEGNVAKAIGKSVLESLGGFLQQLGKQFIAASKLIQTAQALLGTAGGIFAGVALVALGALIKGFASKGFADGGFVSGPGSERSDSIPARLSNGEFVVNARSVRKYGRGFMEMVNNGSIPITNYKNNFSDLRFADGGFVSDARGVSRAIVNRSDFGGDMGGFIAETKISGQDLRLVLKRADSNYSKTT